MPRTIALIYLAAGALWIFLTDRWLEWLDLDPHTLQVLHTAKGWLAILGSAVLLYILLRRHKRRDDAAVSALLESQREVQQINADLEKRVAERTRQLQAANRELESFAYAVSHDLRAPLRSLSGFSQILQETASEQLDEKSLHYLRRIHDASQRMSGLIEALLGLSRISTAELAIRPVNFTQLCTDAAAALRAKFPDHKVQVEIAPNMHVEGDARLLRIAMDCLLANAWKFTIKAAQPMVTVGVQTGVTGGHIYFVRDNGVGFDMAYANKLFVPFQRLHPDAEYQGSGIGLVTAQRVIARHSGRIWAEAQVNEGATFYFTINAPLAPPARP
ncbi:sensor histidine kinase [Peristeroidobacter soli]|jgi:light-regulated signal transduction histidine kinase (bacteriophytochrome)|uniref:sensor histidine kinase n=1 Tax=Peristeroidobacter soli TaxID=2497877 RepID=UPI00101CAA64|nr:ATP-binding protein [Peristeroidobacter soli]